MKKIRKYGLTCILIIAIALTWSSIVFSQTKYASCYGFRYSASENTRRDATNAARSYEIAGYVSFANHDYPANVALSNLTTDDIFFFSGHASSELLQFYNGSTTSNMTRTQVGNRNLNRMRLAVLGGCRTASGTNNITRTFNLQGADCSIGWTTTTTFIRHSFWLDYFNYYLEIGQTVNQARQNADATLALIFGSDVGGTNNHRIYGSGSTKIN
ncbi:UNVERIFIED_CONTAM: hypothetical protein Cloal_0033 [Acetivibrio alkalicellulosi]